MYLRTQTSLDYVQYEHRRVTEVATGDELDSIQARFTSSIVRGMEPGKYFAEYLALFGAVSESRRT